MSTDNKTINPGPDIVLQDHERTRCEVWTRVMGYHRPISAFNDGKKSEHRERVSFREQRSINHEIPA